MMPCAMLMLPEMPPTGSGHVTLDSYLSGAENPTHSRDGQNHVTPGRSLDYLHVQYGVVVRLCTSVLIDRATGPATRCLRCVRGQRRRSPQSIILGVCRTATNARRSHRRRAG